MAFNTGGAAGGALTGAQMGSAFGPIGTGIGALAGGALGGFMGGGDDMELQDMRSAEQKRAAAALMQLGETGSYGGITLGEGYGGALGAYDLSGQTLAGQSSLQNLLTSAFDPNSDIGKARSTFQGLADTTFDPSDPKTGYAAFVFAYLQLTYSIQRFEQLGQLNQ